MNQEFDLPSKKEITLSVKTLIGMVMRSGSIDNRFGGFNRAQEGARIHRQLQKNAEQNYEAEVFLKFSFERENIIINLQGRADGIIRNFTGITIDEIKTVSKNISELTEDDYPEYWAQAKLYAWMITKLENIQFLTIRMTYYQVQTKEIRYFYLKETQESLDQFSDTLFKKLINRVAFINHHRFVRNESIQKLLFPFPSYRMGQKEMASAIYRTVRNGDNVFCSAPTGIGKTMSALFGSLKAIGSLFADRIFYATAKATVSYSVDSALMLLRENGLILYSTFLTAKDKICPLESRKCNSDVCPYARHYYDRVDTVIENMIRQEKNFTQNVITKWALDNELCPFELSLDLANLSDLVVGDYNYLYDPVVGMESLFSTNEDWIFLIDEAHNLPDRGRKMYSTSLEKSNFLELKKSLPKEEKQLRKTTSDINRWFINERKTHQDKYWNIREDDSNLYELNQQLRTFCFSVENKLNSLDSTLSEKVLELYYSVRQFLDNEIKNEEGFSISLKTYKNDVIINKQCLDPSKRLMERNQLAKSIIYYSATLVPIKYFSNILTGTSKTPAVVISSPFDASHLLMLTADSVSTKYKDREQSYPIISEMIDAFISCKKGHYFVFFPSYEYLEKTYDVFHVLYPDIPVFKQEREMNDEKKTNYMKNFSEVSKELKVGFAVLGGSFSESIDLAGNQLIGAIIVGVGLPKISWEQDQIRSYYQSENQNGFDFAYKYPGFNKVLQAIGRIIRSENDFGAVLLIDERFGYPSYQKLFPKYYQNQIFVKDSQEIKINTEKFWKEIDK